MRPCLVPPFLAVWIILMKLRVQSPTVPHVLAVVVSLQSPGEQNEVKY